MPSADRQPFSEAARKRGLIVLLVTTFFGWGGFFFVVPLIGIHFVDGLGWAAAAVGVALAVRQFVQQGLTTLTGAVADQIGAKWLIAGGMVVRAAGFAGLARADTYPVLVLTMTLAAVGGAMFDAPKSAAIAALTTEEERPRYFSLSGLVIGLGITLGTQAGAMLLRQSFDAVAIGSGVCYLLVAALVVLFMPPVDVAQGEGGFWHGFGLALHDRPFMSYIALMAGQWFMNTQFFLTLPLTAVALSGRTETVAWVTGINSAVTVVLGYPMPRMVERRLGARGALVAGVVVTAAGLLGVGLASTTPMLLAAVVIFAAGTTLVRPMEQTVASGLANRAALGSYFGIAALSVAVGGGLGNVLGGYLFDLGRQTGFPALPWLVCACVGGVTALGLHVSLRPQDHRKPKASPATG